MAEVERQIAAGYRHIRSVLVVRHGYLVYEHYWQGLDSTSGHDIRSVTKSVIGALVGIAVGDGTIGLEQTVGELLSRHLPENPDPRWAQVTVRQLLTMTRGLAGDNESLGANSRIGDAIIRSKDWTRSILSQPLQSKPDRRFAYTDAGAHLLSVILNDATGESTLTFARKRLFGPLGINTDGALEPVLGNDHMDPAVIENDRVAPVAWPVDPQGYQYGADLLRLPARDLAKFGYLYLNGGRWDGAQLIPADYVAASISTRGGSPNELMGYGWLWWIGIDSDHQSFRAQGFGSQYIHVVPDLDLVTVITSDPDAGGLDPRVSLLPTAIRSVTG